MSARGWGGSTRGSQERRLGQRAASATSSRSLRAEGCRTGSRQVSHVRRGSQKPTSTTTPRSFERTGLSGALNRYRNVDRDWEDLAAWDGEPVRQPSLFIGGELDASTTWAVRAINNHPQTLPGISSSHIIRGAGHWIQCILYQHPSGDVLDHPAARRRVFCNVRMGFRNLDQP